MAPGHDATAGTRNRNLPRDWPEVETGHEGDRLVGVAGLVIGIGIRIRVGIGVGVRVAVGIRVGAGVRLDRLDDRRDQRGPPLGPGAHQADAAQGRLSNKSDPLQTD